MGIVTLGDFISDIEGSIGNRELLAPRITRFVNYAYFNIAGSIRFHELESFVEVTGASSLSLPNRTITVFAVSRAGILLEYIEPSLFYQRKPKNPPEIWTRLGMNVLIRTLAPASPHSLYVSQRPAPLSGSSATTTIPETWDEGIYLLATHYALMSLSEETRAQAWFGRFRDFVATRHGIADIESLETTLGFRKSQAAQLDIRRAVQIGGSE